MHDFQSEAGKQTATGLGLFVSLVMLAGSSYMNALFAFKFGRGPIDGAVLAALGVSIDVFLMLMPFFLMSAIRGREVLNSIFMLAAWVVLLAVSANAAVGHIQGARIDAMSTKMAAATSYQDNRKEQKRLEERIEWLPKPTESEGSLRAKIKKEQSQLMWQQTAECANQWNSAQKKFCGQVTEMTSALNNVLEYDKAISRLAVIKAQNDAAGANHVAVIPDGVDPQAVMYGKFFQTDPTTVSGVISLLFAMVILMLASMGPYIALTPQRAAARMRAKEATAPQEQPPQLALGTQSGLVIDITPTPPQPPGKAVAGYLVSPTGLSDEAKELLRAIGMPDKPCDKRPQDDDEVVGWRFLAWLQASNLTGDYTGDEIEAYYAAFVVQDNRTPHEAMRIVKNRLEGTSPRFVRKNPAGIKPGGKRGAVWTIRKIPLSVMMEALRKRGIVPQDLPPPAEPEPNAAFQEPAPTPAKNVLSFFRRSADDEPKKASGG